MNLQQRHQIERECERLVLKFMRLFENEHSKAADLFAEDGKFLAGGTEHTVGSATLREGWSHIDAARVELNALVVTNLLVDVIDENSAEGSSYVTHYQYRFKDSKREGNPTQPPAGPMLRCTYEFKAVDGEWKFANLEFQGYYFPKAQ